MTVGSISEFVKETPKKKAKVSPYYQYLDEIVELRKKGYEYKEIEKIFRDHGITIYYSNICKVLKKINKNTKDSIRKGERESLNNTNLRNDIIEEKSETEPSLTSFEKIKTTCEFNPYFELTDKQIHIIIPKVDKLTNEEVISKGMLPTTYRKQRFEYRQNYEKLKTKPGEYFSEIENGKILD